MTSRKNIETLDNTLWDDLLEWERNARKPFFNYPERNELLPRPPSSTFTKYYPAHHLEIERERSHAVPIAGDLATSATG